eukprot:PLAT7075.1.p1 GENE.PLAT7075.1~~PLAT7075.1.p1  ORF type:complete len:826 (+),score=438.94 PLAT7075.1:689-3166(+)
MSLLSHDLDGESKAQPLSALPATFAIDVSGSTSGSIALAQLKSAFGFKAAGAAVDKVIAWSTCARVYRALKEFPSGGGTAPTCFTPMIKRDSNLLLLYTDGLISRAGEADAFVQKMQACEQSFPVVVVLTLRPTYDLYDTVKSLEKQVNMTIPNGVLGASEDVAVLVNVGGDHRLLMCKGIFTDLGCPELTADMVLAALPAVEQAELMALPYICRARLPDGYLRAGGVSGAISLDALYAADSDTPHLAAVCHALCKRTYLPALDIVRLRGMLLRVSKTMCAEQPAIDALYERIFELSARGGSGSEEHRALLAERAALLADAADAAGGAGGAGGGAVAAAESVEQLRAAAAPKLRQVVPRFLTLLAEYEKDKASFVLGSNRATRAAVIGADAFDDVGDCFEVECPILLDDEPACVLLQQPSATYEQFGAPPGCTSLQVAATSDLCQEAPFNCGALLSSALTPGLFGLTFAREAREHPHTRARIIGFIPLSRQPEVVMRHMSKAFGASRVLWHFVRAYVAAVATAAAEHEWLHPLLLEQVRVIMDDYPVTRDLRGGADKVPLSDAIRHVLTHPAALRHRIQPDVTAIMAIAEQAMPAFHFDRRAIAALSQFMSTFANLLCLHKAGEDLRAYIYDVDELGHFAGQHSDLRALIALVLYRRQLAGDCCYKGCKLQMAVEMALDARHESDAALLLAAMQGRPFTVPAIAAAEPEGEHYAIPAPFDEWTAAGRSKARCAYCGLHFPADDRTAITGHMRVAAAGYLYNGHRYLMSEMAHRDSRGDSDAAIFRRIKQRLFKRHGALYAPLHTQHCKQLLLYMIRSYRAAAYLD